MICVRFNSHSYNVEIIQLQSALDDDCNNFSENIKPVSHFRANNWKTFSDKETLEHFARFWRLSLSVISESCDQSLFLFLSFCLDFYGN